MERKIGILGGCFNPVHNGHLRLARVAIQTLRLDRVLFVPCRIPPHKRADRLAPARDRVAMLRRALRDEPRFGLALHEIRRPGVSYSIDTLRRLRRAYPGARLFFLIGSDSLDELAIWKDIGRFPALCEFAVLERPGRPRLRRLAGPLPEGLVVHRLRGRRMAVSSTDLRRRCAAGRTLRGGLPPGVEAYIVQQGLYRKREAHPSTP